MLEKDVAEGIHRVEDAYTNCYLVEDDGALTVVDAGVPTSWDSLHDALRALGRSPRDLRGLVLTHAHFDHIGFAERARREARPRGVALSATALCTSPTGTPLSPRTPCVTLDALAETGATTVVTGHGPPWREGAERAVDRARAAGVS